MSSALTLEHKQLVHVALAGWQLVEVGDEMEALAAVKTRHVDIAILHLSVNETFDMDLPNVLRSVSPEAYLPVIILADELGEQERCRFLDSGADDVIGSGASPPELVAHLGATMRVKELHDQLAASREALEEALKRERELLVELRRDNDRLRSLATTDPLTRVQNLRSFWGVLEHEFKVAKRYNQSLSLLTLDVDHFKLVNDVHGHPSGDYVLKEMAVILKQSVRESDVVARTGGEEFTIILPKADRRQARRFAERIRREVFNRRFTVYGHRIHITVSLGSATFPADAEIAKPEMLMYCADQALLISKENGRDRVASFSELAPAVRARLRRQYLNVPAALENGTCEGTEQIAVGSDRSQM
jgi:diguanylate cyclase (GGDEF)-like protein